MGDIVLVIVECIVRYSNWKRERKKKKNWRDKVSILREIVE